MSADKMRYINPGSSTMTGGDFRKVTKFKSLKLALKELEPFIRNGRHLQVGDGSSGSVGCDRASCWATGCSALHRTPPLAMTATHSRATQGEVTV